MLMSPHLLLDPTFNRAERINVFETAAVHIY